MTRKPLLKLRNSTAVIEKCQHWINECHSWYQPTPNNIEILTHSLWPVQLWLPLLSKSLELSIHCTSNCEHFTFLPREGEENKDTKVKTPLEENECRWLERAADCKRHRSGSGPLLGRGISLYVILTKGNFIGRNQYSKL